MADQIIVIIKESTGIFSQANKRGCTVVSFVRVLIDNPIEHLN